jgi:hypothetical protein
MRHSYQGIAVNEWPINMSVLTTALNERWAARIANDFPISIAG